MFNKITVIITIIIILIVGSVIALNVGFKENGKGGNSDQYVVTINKIDDQSPARILKVYYGEKEIEFKEIRYTDDVFLCKKENPTVFFGDVVEEKELKIIIDNNRFVIAKILKGEEDEKK